MLMKIPTQQQINSFATIEVLAAPTGIHDIEYDARKSIEQYVSEGWIPKK